MTAPTLRTMDLIMRSSQICRACSSSGVGRSNFKIGRHPITRDLTSPTRPILKLAQPAFQGGLL